MLSGYERVQCRHTGFDLHRLSLDSGAGVGGLEAVNCNVPPPSPRVISKPLEAFKAFHNKAVDSF